MPLPDVAQPNAAERRAIEQETAAASLAGALRVALYLADRTGAPAGDVDCLMRLVERSEDRRRAMSGASA